VERVATRAFILGEDKKILVGKRARGMGANQWALVGGKPDQDEFLEETIIREIREELGVQFVDVKFYQERIDVDTDPISPWRVYFYTGKLQSDPKPNLDEILEVKWILADDLLSLDMAFDHKERLEEFFRSVL
jgi:8-oxo-dGTP pyrophosphatase MutT (NUDIX family)